MGDRRPGVPAGARGAGAAAFPQGRLERIEDSYTFVPVDQPERTAELIGAFAGARKTTSTR